MEVSGKQDFDLEVVLAGFRRCRRDGGVLLLEEYLIAFSELCRFFKLTGRLFGFVAKDLRSKIDILETHRCSEVSESFFSIQSMVDFELRENLTEVKWKLPSGSRTLLRLHRALEFILAFMERLANSPDDARTSQIAAEVYNKTLAKHHVWIVRKMALFAVYALPSRNELIDLMCKQNVTEVVQLVNQCVEAAKPVYDETQRLYEEHGLLQLP